MSVTLKLDSIKAHAVAQALVWGDRTARKGGYAALAETMNAVHDDLLLAQLDAQPQRPAVGELAQAAADYLAATSPATPDEMWETLAARYADEDAPNSSLIVARTRARLVKALGNLGGGL